MTNNFEENIPTLSQFIRLYWDLELEDVDDQYEFYAPWTSGEFPNYIHLAYKYSPRGMYRKPISFINKGES
jgi:hypothetical protein